MRQNRQALPAYVYYRNYVRGHRALNGKPASTRLSHHQRTAAPEVLRRLERYVQYKAGQRRVSAGGAIKWGGQDIALEYTLAGSIVSLYETLRGLEVRRGFCQLSGQ